MKNECEIEKNLLVNEFEEKRRKRSVRNNIIFIIGALIICM